MKVQYQVLPRAARGHKVRHVPHALQAVALEAVLIKQVHPRCGHS